LQDDLDQIPEPEANELEDSLGYVYVIFTLLFRQGHSSELVKSLSPLEGISAVELGSDHQILTNSQLTLLKLIDSWLHFSQKEAISTLHPSPSSASSLHPPETSDTGAGLTHLQGAGVCGGLLGFVDVFMQLSCFARNAMAEGTAKQGEVVERQQDKRLIGVHHGLLLVLQCLLSIALAADGWTTSESDELSARCHSTSGAKMHSFRTLSRIMLGRMRNNPAFVDELVG
jgi:ataxin-10